MSYSETSESAYIDMTSAADGRTHTITGAEFDAGVWHGQGTYRAVCGRDVIAASLMSGPGPRCPECPQLMNSDTAQARRIVAALIVLPGVRNLLRACGVGAA